MQRLLLHRGAHLGIMPVCIPERSRRQFLFLRVRIKVGDIGSHVSICYSLVAACVFWDTQEVCGWQRTKNACMIEAQPT